MFETVKSLEHLSQIAIDPPAIDLTSAESRLDPITGQWTIFAPGRDLRPEEIVSEKEVTNTDVACPFCVGHEDRTPSPVWVGNICGEETRVSEGDEILASQDWSVRVVPNKFPAVQSITNRPKVTHNASSSDLFRRETRSGGHEVIVESRHHLQSLSELDLSEIELVFRAYRDRLQHWRTVPGIEYISLFKNVGGKAGASLRHSHSQLIAVDKMPETVRTSSERMARHRSKSGCCLQCDLIRGEQESNQRVVWQDDSLIAFCPFASRLAMTLRITSLEHQACFEDLSSTTIDSVARVVQRAVSWLEKVRPQTAYNYCLHTRPPGHDDPSDSFHWALDLFPRMAQVAGFEWSSNCMINPLLPETAASKFRACVRSEDPRLELGSR